ncbi:MULTISPECIES: hypothetical protein [unclassified Neisseria]|uniref:hypothetical protein n=1 Tax=unclassified Neisseria TaxID=2623750 RepID=UPI0026661599|nr:MULTISPECIES: hypothetical protein [unclassified Neisseria]MDO1508773.1 hypothetical protein [Neisseria sp. MVDL19-042950]MDO1515032.1 hypothetical protein [Neisseria sp. MVDL18-041461]MDO1562392.1 hypothetical protein [Neisseria sp. MVDL20-010259]
MPVLLIQDYLQTQGLRLPRDEVRVAYLATQAVINIGNASIDRSVLWYINDEVVLSEYIEQNSENEALLKKIFMALDSVFSRNQNVQSVAIYALMSSENNEPYLLRLVQQGKGIEQKVPVNEENGCFYLPARTAQTGWLNIVDDVAHWQEQEELQGSHHTRSQSQISLPICTESGAVLGVLHAEYADKTAVNEAAQIDWVALSLALIEPMKALLKYESQEEKND